MRPPSFSIMSRAHSSPASSSSMQMPRRSPRFQSSRTYTAITGCNNNDSNSNEEQYNSMKVPQLRQLLREHGLATSGTKSILVERLSSELQTSALSTNELTENSVSDTIVPKSKKSKIEYPTGGTTHSGAPPSRIDCLPRTRELQLLSSHTNTTTTTTTTTTKSKNLVIIGVDEAGRGPLAGPVVAAAAIVPTNIHGIIDSKKITKEEERERIYEELIASPGIRYAVAVVSAQRIDEINILQATLEGMRMAVLGVMSMDSGNSQHEDKVASNVVSAERMELSYVITGKNDCHEPKSNFASDGSGYYALIDGNKVPKDMPCACESLVKGDGREYSIGAASILAKVTRDRLMHEYDKMYPMYNLSQHKGYPTEAHRSAVMKYGASPIHRRTFAPLKSMKFDDHGNVIR